MDVSNIPDPIQSKRCDTCYYQAFDCNRMEYVCGIKGCVNHNKYEKHLTVFDEYDI